MIRRTFLKALAASPLGLLLKKRPPEEAESPYPHERIWAEDDLASTIGTASNNSSYHGVYLFDGYVHCIQKIGLNGTWKEISRTQFRR